MHAYQLVQTSQLNYFLRVIAIPYVPYQNSCRKKISEGAYPRIVSFELHVLEKHLQKTIKILHLKNKHRADIGNF